MSIPHLLAFSLNLIGALIVALVGITYLLRKEFMPYHSVAVGKPWAEVAPGYQALLLGLIRALGWVLVSLSLLQLVVLLLPFWRGEAWAVWAVPISGLLVSILSFSAMSHVARNTPAKPPLVLPIIGGAVSIAALFLAPWAIRATGI